MPLIRLNDININYKSEGHGEPLVMIAGFSAGRSSLISQISFFKRHYRVISFDNRGAGKSDKPSGPYSTKMMADDVVKLMDYLGIAKAHVLGTSMGGMIAQELAINHPQRVIKLVLACTYSRQDETSGDTAEQAELSRLSPEKITGALISMSFNRPLYRFTIGLIVRILSGFMGPSARVGIAGQTDACRMHDTLDRLSSIKVPTLVIAGTEDRLINPVSSDVIAGKIPGTRLVKVEGGSHTFFMEMKKVFNREVLNFLKDNDPVQHQ